MKYPREHDDEEKPRQTCQVARPAWYNDHTLFYPIKDWTDEELAIEHARVKRRMALETGDES